MNPDNDNGRNEPLSPTDPSSEDREGEPGETFPPFDDPAFSSKAPSSPPADDVSNRGFQGEDPIFAGHPDFSQDAAKNKPPKSGVGNSEAIDDVNEETRHSDGQNPTRSSPL